MFKTKKYDQKDRKNTENNMLLLAVTNNIHGRNEGWFNWPSGSTDPALPYYWLVLFFFIIYFAYKVNFMIIFIILDIKSVPGKNCLYINHHRIQETSCLNSDVTAICGPKGNYILFDT